MKEGLVGGQGFAIDASLISADVQKQNSSNPDDWAARVADVDDAPRAVQEYLETLDNEAFGAATTTKPRFRTHNQNMTVAASAIADRNTLGHRS